MKTYKDYNNPMDYYRKDKALEKKRDYAVEHNFKGMMDKEVFSWANELAEFFQMPKPKFNNANEAKRFIQMYYKR